MTQSAYPRRDRIPQVLRKQVYARDRGRCRLCGEPVAWMDYHCDHKVPYSFGGPTSLSNLRTTHKKCNLSRGTREVQEYDYFGWGQMFAWLLVVFSLVGLVLSLIK